MVYVASGLILGTTLAQAPNPQYSLAGYLIAIYAAYAPTQLPIAIGEMVVTGLALQYAYRQRPEVLQELGIIKTRRIKKNSSINLLLVVAFAGLLLHPGHIADAANEKQVSTKTDLRTSDTQAAQPKKFAGMDEAVNEKLAEAAGRPARAPYIDTESMGDLWNLLLLSAGGICGFIVGRWWHLLWGSRQKG